MKEYKGKFTTKLFWTACGLCAGWFVFNLLGRFTHSFLISAILSLIVIAWMFHKIYYSDNISIVFTDDNQLLIKRFGQIVKGFLLINIIGQNILKIPILKMKMTKIFIT